MNSAIRVWRNTMPLSLRKSVRPVVNAALRGYLDTNLRRVRRDLRPGPVVLSGFFDEPLGIGRAAECTLRSLTAAGLPVVRHAIRPSLQSTNYAGDLLPTEEKGGVHIMHCNPPEARALLMSLAPGEYRQRYRVGYWAYELPQAPDDWIDLTSAFDEVWVPSKFVAGSLSASRCNIRVMPHDVTNIVTATPPDRAAFDLPESGFLALAAGDLRSSATRKNLAGAVDIFCRAFPSPSPGVGLVLKISFEKADPTAERNLRAAIAQRPDIMLLTEHLDGDGIMSLIASCDLFLSPHRAEGFGMMIAEALALGKPVLATAWSGNMDIIGSIPDAQIAAAQTPVIDPSGIYSGHSGQKWADPDIENGAHQLRAIAASADLRTRIVHQGQQALERLSTAWSPTALEKCAMSDWIARPGNTATAEITDRDG